MSARKALNVIANVLVTAIFTFAVCFAAFVVVATLASGKGEASVLGWKPYIVLSDSMRSEFEVGDIAVSREVDPSALEPGDIVTFASIDPDSYGEVFTHKIREITEYEGEPAFVTYGTTTGDDDAYPAPFSRVAGQYAFRIPKAGYAFEFFKSPLGYVVLVLVPCSILIGLQVRSFLRLLKESRKQKELDLAAERRKVELMQAEIDRLRRVSPAPQPGYAPVPSAGERAPRPASARIVSVPHVVLDDSVGTTCPLHPVPVRGVVVPRVVPDDPVGVILRNAERTRAR